MYVIRNIQALGVANAICRQLGAWCSANVRTNVRFATIPSGAQSWTVRLQLDAGGVLSEASLAAMQRVLAENGHELQITCTAVTPTQRRQRARARPAPARTEPREQQAQTPIITWSATDTWGSEHNPQPIRGMAPAHLWSSVNWAVRNKLRLFQAATAERAARAVPELAAALWLRAQPAFRALVREAIRQQLAFPDDVHEFLRHYVRDNQFDVLTPPPWADPQGVQRTIDELSPILDQTPTVTQLTPSRPLRRIEFED